MAAAALGLNPTRHPSRLIRGLGSKVVQSKVMYAVPLVVRNGDIKKWERLPPFQEKAYLRT
jgi:hypothetical protein